MRRSIPFSLSKTFLSKKNFPIAIPLTNVSDGKRIRRINTQMIEALAVSTLALASGVVLLNRKCQTF
jgi:hypothetical protein